MKTGLARPLASRRVNIVIALLVLIGSSSYASAAPTVLNVNPPGGPVGAFVSILGSGFGASQGSSTVTFNGTPATWVSWSSTQLYVLVPVGATTGQLLVTVGGASSSGQLFRISSAPTITALMPTLGTSGTTVTITGSGFTGGGFSSPYFYFNPSVQANVLSYSDTSIVATVPAGATTGNVAVR